MLIFLSEEPTPPWSPWRSASAPRTSSLWITATSVPSVRCTAGISACCRA